MKFELVEFYETTEENKAIKGQKCIGTVHIYLIDCELDIRGINVTMNGKGVFFHIPHFWATDQETGKRIRYPLIHFTNDKTQKEMTDFLHKDVKPKIFEILKSKSKK